METIKNKEKKVLKSLTRDKEIRDLKKDLWKAVEEYVNSVKAKLPIGLIISHGYSIDDRKEWKKMRKKFSH